MDALAPCVLEDAMRSVYPSGADFATASAAMLPPAPARFSTTTGAPSARPRGPAMARATTSGWPPGAKGTTSFTGWAGAHWAATGKAARNNNNDAAVFIPEVSQRSGNDMNTTERELVNRVTNRLWGPC